MGGRCHCRHLQWHCGAPKTLEKPSLAYFCMSVLTKGFHKQSRSGVLTLRLSSGVTARLSVPPPSAKGCIMPWKLTLFQYLQEGTDHTCGH